MATITGQKEKSYQKLVNALSIAVPLAVAVLIGIRQKIDLGVWTKMLPHLIGIINSMTALFLLAGLVFIRQKNIRLHRASMLAAFTLGAIFLVSYVLYHISNPSTSYGGAGFLRYVYYFLLVSHIGLSVVVVRFVLLALYYALSNQIARHKKTVRWAYPIWLYVSVTGVIVYLMISPYYQ